MSSGYKKGKLILFLYVYTCTHVFVLQATMPGQLTYHQVPHATLEVGAPLGPPRLKKKSGHASALNLGKN